MRSRIPIFLLLALLQGCLPEDTPKAQVNGQAPDIAVQDKDEQDVSLTDFKGQKLLVSFWFSGCGPCTAELPLLDVFQDEAAEHGAKIITINMRDGIKVVRDTARRMGLSLPMYADRLSITSKRYAVTAAPTNFVIGPDGRILKRVDGAVDLDFLYDEFINVK